MKLFRKILAFAMVAAFMVIPMQPVHASGVVHTLQDTPPAMVEDGGITLYGANPPKGSADIHDLSISDYEYQVSDVGAAVYTSKWIKGASTIHVTAENWTLLESYHGATNNKLTVTVYDSDKDYVNSTTITIDSTFRFGSGDITGLNSTEKYYVRFSVPLNSNRYSFNGAISAK